MDELQDKKNSLLSKAASPATEGIEGIYESLSVRAKHILSRLGVEDVDALLKLTRNELTQAWSCGKKTIAEIEKLKSQLRPKNEQEPIQVSRPALDFGNASKEVFDAVRGVLSVRAIHVLEDLDVDDLKVFMMLERSDLLQCRNCGRKTANEILRIQSDIDRFAQDSIGKFNGFLPEQLLTAEFLLVNKPNKTNGDNAEGIFPDVNDPAPWLSDWIRALSRSRKQARAFMLRKGMLGVAPMTLEVVGKQVGGVTRERARQMEVAVEKKAAAPSQQHRLRPLIEEFAAKVNERGGMASLDELTKEVLCKGQNGRQLMFATELVKFFSTLQVWMDAGLVLQKDGVVRNGDSRTQIQRLAKMIEEVASANADERYADELWSIDRERLKKALKRSSEILLGTSQTINISNAMLDAIVKYCKNRIKAYKNRIYSLSLWRLRFGNITQMLDTVLRQMAEPAHFTEVYKYASRWRPGLSDRNVHATLDRSDSALLWDRGTFVHKNNIVIPLSLIQDVESWLLNVLKQDVPFVSINGAFSHFRTRCERAGFPSEVALYTCLRKSAHPDLTYPRLPFVYVKKGFTQRIPILIGFEEFLRDAGGVVSQQELREFGIEKIFLKDFQFYQVTQRVSNVLRTANWGYLHIENAELNQELIQSLIQYTQELLGEEEHFSVAKLFREKIVTCKSAGIDSPVMLYSVLQAFAEDFFSLNGYPRVARADVGQNMGRHSIKRRVLDFVRDSGKPCPYEVLEKRFVEELGYKDYQVYTVALESEVCFYHPGCVIHYNSLGWDGIKQRELENIAFRIYENAVRAGSYFGRVSYLLESIDLPPLPTGMYWSHILIAELLAKGGRYIVLGNSREAFLPRDNDQKIHSFEVLVAKILNRDWGGAANLAAFEGALRKMGIIRRHVNQTMFGSGKIVAITNGEIILRELLSDAQRS